MMTEWAYAQAYCSDEDRAATYDALGPHLQSL